MIFVILTLVAVVGFVVIIVLDKTTCVDPYQIVHVVGYIACIASFILCGVLWLSMSVETDKFIKTFTHQKQYIESHVAKNDVEDAALTSEKIALNTKLYKWQYGAEYFPAFNFYNEEVLSLKEIQ
jgi:hypothetical protein